MAKSCGGNYHKVRVWGNMISKYESENKIVKLKHPQGEHGDPENRLIPFQEKA